MATKKPAPKTQTFPNREAAVKQAMKQGEKSITFRLPSKKKK